MASKKLLDVISASFVDRRPNGKDKSVPNRQRFLDRIKHIIKNKIPTIIKERSIKNIAGEGGDIFIPRGTIKEPSFRHSRDGIHERIYPGNKEFSEGDRFTKPDGEGDGSGRGGSNGGGGEDDFIIQISREEFLNYFFEDLELPDMIKQNMKQIEIVKYHNGGYTNAGIPARLDLKKSMRNALSRQTSMEAIFETEIEEAENRLKEIELCEVITADLQEEKLQLESKLEELRKDLESVSFIDPIDLKYRTSVKEVIKSSTAVMFCIMDNSGSMGEREKIISRKFFVLLYMFLERKYEKIDVRFIYHTEVAKEVDEHEFFHSRDSGGTIISSALELTKEIIQKDYSDGTDNIYICQCSDGDNWHDDNKNCKDLLLNEIMPKVQYYAYLQVNPDWAGYDHRSDIWDTYQEIANQHPNFQMTGVKYENEIYQVFRELFEKKV